MDELQGQKTAFFSKTMLRIWACPGASGYIKYVLFGEGAYVIAEKSMEALGRMNLGYLSVAVGKTLNAVKV